MIGFNEIIHDETNFEFNNTKILECPKDINTRHKGKVLGTATDYISRR